MEITAHPKIVLLVAIIYFSYVLGEDRSNEGLTSFPHDLLPNEQFYILDNNPITSIDYIEYYQFCNYISFKNNLLSEFPDFSNLTALLAKIYLDNNLLTTIPYGLLDILTALEYLSLKGNDITSLPDAPGPGNTLTTILINDNNFTSVPQCPNLFRSLQILRVQNNPIAVYPSDMFASFPEITEINMNYVNEPQSPPDLSAHNGKLTKAYYKGNGWTTINVEVLTRMTGMRFYFSENEVQRIEGNFFYHDRTNLATLILHMDQNPIICDCRAKWLKVAEMEQTPQILSATCASPPTVAGQLLSSLTLSDFDCPVTPGGFREVMPNLVLASYHVPVYDVTSSHKVTSVIVCVGLCLDQKDCLVFGWSETPNGEHNCGLTTYGSVVPTRTAPWDDSSILWYMLE